MERKKTLSLVSTIMMTIYAALVTIFNLWMFAMAAVLGHQSGAICRQYKDQERNSENDNFHPCIGREFATADKFVRQHR